MSYFELPMLLLSRLNTNFCVQTFVTGEEEGIDYLFILWFKPW